MDSGSRIPDSGFQIPVKLGFWIPIVSRIPDPLSCILDSKAQDSGFHEQNFPEFRILHVKIFSDSGIRIPLRTRGETDRVWKPPSGGSRGEARGTLPPPLISIISSPNWGPNSWKKVFLRPPPPLFEGPPLPFTVYSHFSVSLVCQKQAVHPGLVDAQALLGQKTTSQPTREFKTANRQWHFHLKYRYPNHRHSRFC